MRADTREAAGTTPPMPQPGPPRPPAPLPTTAGRASSSRKPYTPTTAVFSPATKVSTRRLGPCPSPPRPPGPLISRWKLPPVTLSAGTSVSTPTSISCSSSMGAMSSPVESPVETVLPAAALLSSPAPAELVSLAALPVASPLLVLPRFWPSGASPACLALASLLCKTVSCEEYLFSQGSRSRRVQRAQSWLKKTENRFLFVECFSL